jgi:hypothetical protein
LLVLLLQQRIQWRYHDGRLLWRHDMLYAIQLYISLLVVLGLPVNMRLQGFALLAEFSLDELVLAFTVWIHTTFGTRGS